MKPQNLPKEKETTIQNRIRDFLSLNGWFVIRHQQSLGSLKGLSDLTAIKDGITVYIEVKTPRGVQSEYQKIFQLKTCVDSPASKRSVGGGRKRTNLLDKLIISPYNIFSGEGGENCGTNKNIKDKDLCDRRTVEEIPRTDGGVSEC